MPNPANPQSLNRYSYVNNNPLRYVDPSGHMPCEEYQGACLSDNQMTNIWNNTTGNGNNNNNNNDDDDEDNDSGEGGGGDMPELPLGSPSPVDGYYCQATTLTCWANFAQDMATTVDFIFAGVEVVFVVGGCAAGPEGCVGGLLTSWTIFNSGPNQMEAALMVDRYY